MVQFQNVAGLYSSEPLESHQSGFARAKWNGWLVRCTSLIFIPMSSLYLNLWLRFGLATSSPSAWRWTFGMAMERERESDAISIYIYIIYIYILIITRIILQGWATMSTSKAPAKHQQSTSYFDVKLRGYKGLIHMVSWVWWTIWDGESFAGRFQGVWNGLN